MGKRKFLIYGVISSIVLSVAIFAIIVFGITDFNSPTACSPDPGSLGWFNCENAFADGGGTATASGSSPNATKATHWYNYNFNIPTNNIISSVVVRLDAYKSGVVPVNSSAILKVLVSKDFGVTWGPAHYTPSLTNTEQTYLIDVTSDFTWAPADFDNSKFKVVVSNSFAENVTFYLDWVPVEVQHTTPPPQTISGGTSYLPFVSDETVLQRGDWMQTETQFVSHQGNPSQYTMMRPGAITGISIHCERAPVSCTSDPTIEARITPGGNAPPSTIPVATVSLPNGQNAAFNVVPLSATLGAAFRGGDTISVFAQDYGTCSQQPGWCTALVEITTEFGTFQVQP
ncbi:TPA: hypothetical protein H1016_03845 [archaeon]|uniref:Uncharacterized protein n=1 Tax=Candidatus Naiadarchaeum limnaeum TaxID=2756139 RepID=A0A832VAN0_9ARCH|nr:hypothetical protein [Candidatus Naiadarchaeum limnaeum]